MVIKTDKEEALNAVIRKLKLYRGSDTQTMQEHNPVGSSQSNGATERRIQTIEGQIRTLRNAFESRTGSQLPTSNPLFAWLVVHAGAIIALFETERDGRVPFQRLRGRKMHPEMIESGERIMYQPLDHKQLGSAMPRWEEGVYVGLRMHTGEKLVATTNSVCKARSIKRSIESERWDAEEISKVNGTPWKPYLYSEDDQLLSRAPAPAVVDDPSNPKRICEVDKEAVPRSFSIQRKYLVNHGYTPGCQGCYAAANDRTHKPHTPGCRARIAKALMDDEAEAHRIIDAREREDAFLEKAIMEGDIRVDNSVAAAPNTPTTGSPYATDSDSSDPQNGVHGSRTHNT